MSEIVADTPESIAFFRMLSVRGRLRIEVETGLKFRTATLTAAIGIYDLKSRTKKAALAEMNEMIDRVKAGEITARELEVDRG